MEVWLITFSADRGGVCESDPTVLVPGRLADYCNFEWVALRGAGLGVLLLAGIVGLFWRFMSHPSWYFGKRLSGSLDALDWAWILGCGVFLPLIWHGMVTRLPAFGARELSLDAIEFIQPVLQELATLFLILASTIQALRWRLARRLAVFGFGCRRFAWFWWLPVAGAALALPLASLPVFVSESWSRSFLVSLFSRVGSGAVSTGSLGKLPVLLPLVPSALLLLILFFWMLGFFFGVFIGRPKRTPFRAAASYVFASACAPVVLVLAFVASPLVKMEFRHWLFRDIPVARPEWNGLGKYEYLKSKRIQEQMARALESAEAKR
jgi:hypothetical protein